MPILFSAVASENHIIADFASCDGNFMEILQQVISKMPSIDEKMTYYHGPYLIHYITENKHIYFCITNKVCQRSRAFLFLNQIHRRFFADGKDNFTEVLAAEMYRYSEDYNTITIRKGEIDELNTIGVESSETILGEKLLFVNNPEKISYATVSYVGKPPEEISISVEKSKFYVIAIGILIFIIGAVYTIGPISSVVVVSVISLSLFRYILNQGKTSE